MNYFFTTFTIKQIIMAAITLKNIPKDLHRDIKMLQMDLEDEEKKMNLEEIYLMLAEKGLKQYKKENPGK